jgi:SAM-dependent methyltransferase
MGFEELLAEAAAAPLEGWDFSWLDGRATEQRPSWGYQRTIAARLPTVAAALDVQTGGGEVLAGVPVLPPLMAATEGWAPNVARATGLLHPRGVVVVAVADGAALPFGDAAFDLVTSRHPVRPPWSEIARVLRPGGTYLAQHVGPASMFDLIELFTGPVPAANRHDRHPDREAADARAAGLEVVGMREERLRAEFLDVGAVAYLLRKVVWLVPDFDVERYRDRLRELHERIRADGKLVAHSSRVLVEARRPVASTP